MNGPVNHARVVFACGTPMLRQGIARSLSDSDDISVVAEVGTIEEARESLEAAEVDAVLLGTDLPDGHALELARELKSDHHITKVVILSATDDEEAFLAAVRARVDGYVLGSSSYEQLVRVLRSVLAGNCNFDPAICSPTVRRLAGGSLDHQGPAAEHIDLNGLSCRERQVARLMAEGMTNKEIARELGTSISTIKTHVSRIFRHLGISHRHELLPRFLPVGATNNK